VHSESRGIPPGPAAEELPTAELPAEGLRDRTAELAVIKQRAVEGLNEEAALRQHRLGKLTARERIGRLLDGGSFTELEMLRRHRAVDFAMGDKRPHTDGVVTGWGTVDGRKVFVYAHDFGIFGGSLGEAHAAKIHKVMDLAESSGVPLIGLNDGAGARIQVLMRKAYGGAYIVMDSRSIGTDLSFAWPCNEVAVMGAEAAANVIHRRGILAAQDPLKTRRALIEDYRRTLMHPYYGAERGLVDDVIDPRDTRSAIHAGLEMLRSKRVVLPQRKHGNSPL
jgi:acetyl-CoA carboxylase carboxyltransferase component